MMLKMVAFLDRRRDLTLEAYSEHWRTTHRELALDLVTPGIMKGYVQNHRIDRPILDLPAPTDGCPEVWIEDVGEVARLQSSPYYLEKTHPDEANFMEGAARMMLTTETVVVPGPGRFGVGDTVKVLMFFRAKPGMSRADFAAWASLDAPILMPDAAPIRLTRDTAIEHPDFDALHEYDGMESTWWPDVDTFLTAWAARTETTASAWIDPAVTTGMFVDPLNCYDPPSPE